MNPEPELTPAERNAAANPPAASGQLPARRSVVSRMLGLVFVIFCFEVGVFLVVFPWLGIWENNMVPATIAPWLADLWGNPFFRGALSGIGLVNVYISFVEMVGLVRH